MPEEGQGSKRREAREEQQLKAFWNITKKKKTQDDNSHCRAVVDINRSYEVT